MFALVTLAFSVEFSAPAYQTVELKKDEQYEITGKALIFIPHSPSGWKGTATVGGKDTELNFPNIAFDSGSEQGSIKIVATKDTLFRFTIIPAESLGEQISDVSILVNSEMSSFTNWGKVSIITSPYPMLAHNDCKYLDNTGAMKSGKNVYSRLLVFTNSKPNFTTYIKSQQEVSIATRYTRSKATTIKSENIGSKVTLLKKPINDGMVFDLAVYSDLNIDTTENISYVLYAHDKNIVQINGKDEQAHYLGYQKKESASIKYKDNTKMTRICILTLKSDTNLHIIDGPGEYDIYYPYQVKYTYKEEYVLFGLYSEYTATIPKDARVFSSDFGSKLSGPALVVYPHGFDYENRIKITTDQTNVFTAVLDPFEGMTQVKGESGAFIFPSLTVSESIATIPAGSSIGIPATTDFVIVSGVASVEAGDVVKETAGKSVVRIGRKAGKVRNIGNERLSVIVCIGNETNLEEDIFVVGERGAFTVGFTGNKTSTLAISLGTRVWFGGFGQTFSGWQRRDSDENPEFEESFRVHSLLLKDEKDYGRVALQKFDAPMLHDGKLLIASVKKGEDIREFQEHSGCNELMPVTTGTVRCPKKAGEVLEVDFLDPRYLLFIHNSDNYTVEFDYKHGSKMKHFKGRNESRMLTKGKGHPMRVKITADADMTLTLSLFRMTEFVNTDRVSNSIFTNQVGNAMTSKGAAAKNVEIFLIAATPGVSNVKINYTEVEENHLDYLNTSVEVPIRGHSENWEWKGYNHMIAGQFPSSVTMNVTNMGEPEWETSDYTSKIPNCKGYCVGYTDLAPPTDYGILFYVGVNATIFITAGVFFTVIILLKKRRQERGGEYVEMNQQASNK